MKIRSISEVSVKRSGEYGDSHFAGYRIELAGGEIAILVSDDQDCCESWGYLSSEDDFSSFVGAEILGFEIVEPESYDKKLIELGYSFEEYQPEWGLLDEGGAAFIRVLTSNGPIEFAVYNAHNGYYGHEYIIEATGFKGDKGWI